VSIALRNTKRSSSYHENRLCVANIIIASPPIAFLYIRSKSAGIIRLFEERKEQVKAFSASTPHIIKAMYLRCVALISVQDASGWEMQVCTDGRGGRDKAETV